MNSLVAACSVVFALKILELAVASSARIETRQKTHMDQTREVYLQTDTPVDMLLTPIPNLVWPTHEINMRGMTLRRRG